MVEATYEASKAEMTLHSFMRESIKLPKNALNRIRAGETNGGVHSPKKGKDTGRGDRYSSSPGVQVNERECFKRECWVPKCQRVDIILET